jgi:glycosyltransferase involved in cell wall biosynthesis
MMRVSILIPCFNARQWIRQAIESALAQTWPETEVLVRDDGSSDGSLEIIREFDGRVQWEAGPNAGANAVRNRLLERATGAWVQYLDADDYLLPEKIASQVRFLDAHPDTDLVFGPVTLEHTAAAGATRELLAIPEPHDPWILLARWYLPQTGAPLWRKQAIEAVGGWKDDQPACQEHELYLRMLMAGRRFRYHESNGAVYRQWSDATLWKKDQARTRRLKLEIEDRLEAFLTSTGELTAERHWAVNMARFETARSAWQHDRSEAVAIIRRIHESMPGFVPAGPAAPLRYQRAYRWLGFRATETLASLRRG